jgi:hypothetical protein
MRAEVANLTPADVERIIGSIEDHDIARIVGTGASASDLADAIACMQAGSYAAGTGPIRLTRAGEQVLQILQELQTEHELSSPER